MNGFLLVEKFGHHRKEARRLHLILVQNCNTSGIELLTGLVNHLPPPVSNQLRCPPFVVVHSTAKGFCLNSSNGIASLTAIYFRSQLTKSIVEGLASRAYRIVFCMDGKQRNPYGK